MARRERVPPTSIIRWMTVLDSGGDYVVADRFNNSIQLCPASSFQCDACEGTGTAGSTATQLCGHWPLTPVGSMPLQTLPNHRMQLCSALANTGTDCITVAGTGMAGSDSPRADGATSCDGLE